MKKGFTLIELLAVIMILSFIMAITIPSIKRAIESSENKLYEASVNQILKGAKQYRMEFGNEVPNLYDTGVGYITVNDMISKGILKSSIENPKTGELFTGEEAVMMTKMPNGNYDYDFLIDGAFIFDGLVAHYTFNDFQEPTENLIDPTPNSWGGAANVEDLGNYKTIVSNFDQGESLDWYRAESEKIYADEGDYLTCSFDYYNHEGQISVFLREYDDDGSRGAGNSIYFLPNDNYQQKKYSSTIEVEPDINYYRVWITVYNRDYNFDYEQYLELSNLQVEKKDHTTLFVNSERTGEVKDCSGNSNNAVLELDTTPKWIESGKQWGAYEFNGLDDYIDLSGELNSFGNTGDFTISAWIKTSSDSKQSIITSGYASAGLGRYGLYTDEVVVRNSSNVHSNANYIDYIDGNWHYLVGIFDRTNNKIVFLIDGEQQAMDSWDGTLANNASGIMSIGNLQRPSGTDAYYFNGSIDDVRLYNRALTEDEIKEIYNMQK